MPLLANIEPGAARLLQAWTGFESGILIVSLLPVLGIFLAFLKWGMPGDDRQNASDVMATGVYRTGDPETRHRAEAYTPPSVWKLAMFGASDATTAAPPLHEGYPDGDERQPPPSWHA